MVMDDYKHYKCVSMVEEIITCSICVELTDDPRVLQCLHTYCYKCLVQYLSSKDKQDEIECPVCRKWCPLPNGNVDDLPVSFLYNQLKDANTAAGGAAQDEGTVVDEEDKSRFTCSTSECACKKAVAFCETCRYICLECESVHKSISLLRSHVILSLEEAVKDKLNELPVCPKHPREIVKLYCEDCQLPICLLCYPLNHAQHKCHEIIDKSSKLKVQLKDMVGTMDTYIDTCDKMAKLVANHSEKIDYSAAGMKKHISATIDKIQQDIFEHKDAIIRAVDKNYLQVQKLLQQDTDRVNLLHTTLDSVKSCAVKVLLYGKPCDFFQSVPSIQKQLDKHNPDDVIKVNLNDLDVAEAKKKLDNLKLIDDAMATEQKLKEKDEKIHRLRVNQERERQDNLEDAILKTQKLQRRDDDINKLRRHLANQKKDNLQSAFFKTHELEKKADEISKLRKSLENEKKDAYKLKMCYATLRTRNNGLETELELKRKKIEKEKEDVHTLKITYEELTSRNKELEKKLELNNENLEIEKKDAHKLRISYATLASRGNELEKQLEFNQQNMPQPPGGKWSSSRGSHLEINCVFPDGIQNAAHPDPGQPYKGLTLTHTIYNTAEGLHVVKLLEKSFHAQILVTVKDSHLCWNGDVFSGYYHSHSYYTDNKDPTRIRKRLAEMGIK